jgi:hypothetical protein
MDAGEASVLSLLQSQWKLKAIVERLEQCGLRLNLEKT